MTRRPRARASGHARLHAGARFGHNRLLRWHRRGIYALTAMLVVTGLAWLWVAYVLAPPGEPTPAPHAYAGTLLMWHGVAAYAALVACALVGQTHLRIGWRLPSQRVAGVMLTTSLLGLAVGGLGFYYVATEAVMPWLRWSHVALGLLLPAGLAWHIVRGRRLLHRDQRSPAQST